jgi:NADPH2:quinone reductase
MALVGITAWLGLVWRAKLQPGETVFVNGGTGGVGVMVVQMAKAIGAKIIATVGSTEKAKLATQFGADATINYKTDDLSARVKEITASCGVDVWYETQPPSDFERTFALVAPAGRIILTAGRGAKPIFPNGAFYPKNLQLFGFAMFNVATDVQRRAAVDMNRWMSEGKLKSLIGARFPLSGAVDAHRLQEENTVGKKGTLTGKIVVLPG